MAKGVFISLYDESACGIRILSACLKNAGHESHVIFFKGYRNSRNKEEVSLREGEIPWEGIGPYNGEFYYAVKHAITGKEKDMLADLVSEIGPDFIGMTVNTPLLWKAIEVSAAIKKRFPSIPLVWGGFEPTVNPDGALKYCDYAARGECEYAIVDIARAMDEERDLRSIKNLSYLDKGRLLSNGLYPPCEDLSSLPFQDISREDKYFIDGDALTKAPNFLFPSPGVYSTITGRGCVFQCAYCCELYMKELYKPNRYQRRRRPEEVLSELEAVKARGDINYVIFQDEIFSYDIKWLEKFLPEYKRRIGIPFTAFLYPSMDFRTKIELLKAAGMSGTCIAVQSGSPEIAKGYNRHFDREMLLDAARILRENNLSFYTDVITYNSLETKEDLEKTLGVLLDLPQPYEICINKLYLLPGTELYNRTASPGMDDIKKNMFRFYTGLFLLAGYFKCSRALINAVKAIGIFEKDPVVLAPVLYLARFFGKLNLMKYKMNKLLKNGRLNLKYLQSKFVKT
ncbi:MAG: radical SAM protein [Candidatus Omnitrophica bacterium]|nr:radical SAM protein [Candidatus Omnitrophota bacterium]